MFSHCGKTTSRCSPTIWHKGNNSNRTDERQTGAESPENAQFLIPEPQEQKRPERPFRNAQEPSGPTNAEHRVKSKNKRAVADIRRQCLRFVVPPFLVSEKQKRLIPLRPGTQNLVAA